MRMYRGRTGVWFRTQSEGKASGEPFEAVDVPTDHAGLTKFLNSLAAPPPSPAPDPSWDMLTEGVQWSEEQAALMQDRPYKNGHPTTPFMGSRDPRAVFTCVNCGKDNSNGRS